MEWEKNDMEFHAVRDWFPLYTKDWLTSMQLRLCTIEARGVLIDLMCLSWERGTPGIIEMPESDLAQFLRVGKKKMLRILTELEERGRIQREADLFGGNLERISIPRLIAVGDDQAGKHQRRVDAGKKRHQKPEEEKPKAEPKPVEFSYPPEFEEFWGAYPRKVGKRSAEQIWTRWNLKGMVREIVKSVNLWRDTDQWRKDGGRFIPHPSTWLNRAGWEDIPEIEKSLKDKIIPSGGIYITVGSKHYYKSFKGDDWKEQRDAHISKNGLTDNGTGIFTKEEK